LYKIAKESVKGMKVAIDGGVGPFFRVKLIGAMTWFRESMTVLSQSSNSITSSHVLTSGTML
jgi:hypothetical protein